MTGRVIISITGLKLTTIEKQIVAHPHTAAVLVFTRNFKSNEQLKDLLREIQVYSKKEDLPVFVDQEGGQIQRFRGNGFNDLSSARAMGLDPEKIQPQVKELTSDMVDLGMISLVPVVDLDLGNSVITGKDRSFGQDPNDVATLIERYIKELAKYGHSATLKHFPGHGQVYNDGNDDSHFCTPVDNRDLDTISQNDLIPFMHNFKHASAIMPAHILYPKIDPDNIVSFSKIWLYDILRVQFGFDGIIVSDCLSMAGAGTDSMLAKVNKSLELVDIAIMCNIPEEETLHILNNLDNGLLSEERTNFFREWTKFGREYRQQLKELDHSTITA